MSAHIVDNFWENIKENKDLITRCFRHHFKRHPDAEGWDGSFNNLMVRFYELKVFERFDLNRLLEAAGKEGALIDEDITIENLELMGIDVEKKWEQFIYKWIEKVISYQYTVNGKRTKMFISERKYSVDTGIPKEEKNSWIATENAEEYEKKFAAYKENDRRGRKFAPTFENRFTPSGDEFDNPLEVLSANSLENSIREKLTGKRDIAVFNLLSKGLPEKEIATELNVTQQYVNMIAKRIREVTRSLCEV